MEIKCIKLNDMTESICENNFKVRYMLPGERAEFYNRKNKTILESDVLESSPNRARVVCPIFYECGGCDFLHIKYDEQLRMKESYVKTVYFKANVYAEFLPIIKNEKALNYRHKIVASATTEKNKVRLGLYQEGTKKVIPYTSCHIQDSDGNEVLKTVEMVLNKYKMTAYDIDKETGIIKHILIRKSFKTNDMLLVFVTNGNLLPNAKKMAQDVIKLHPKVVTVIQNVHHRKTALVLLDEEKILYGSGYITDEIDGVKFRLSSKSFYQVNPSQMIKMYQKAIELADIKKDEVVLDAYSGIGTISLLATKYAKKVIAVETNKTSHQDALFNKKLNNIDNIQFINEDVSKYLESYKEKIDILIMDPTRDGASEEFLKSVLRLQPKRVVYISCEPLTQVRDIKILSAKYEVKVCQPVDMFSQTVHVESITLLSLK